MLSNLQKQQSPLIVWQPRCFRPDVAALTCNLVDPLYKGCCRAVSSACACDTRRQAWWVFLMTRLAEFTGFIYSYGVRSWPDRTFVGLAEEIAASSLST